MTLNVLQLLFCVELCRNINGLDVVCVFNFLKPYKALFLFAKRRNFLLQYSVHSVTVLLILNCKIRVESFDIFYLQLLL